MYERTHIKNDNTNFIETIDNANNDANNNTNILIVILVMLITSGVMKWIVKAAEWLEHSESTAEEDSNLGPEAPEYRLLRLATSQAKSWMCLVFYCFSSYVTSL